MLYNVNIGSSFQVPSGIDTPWKLKTSKNGHYYLEREDIRSRIQIPRVKGNLRMVGKLIGDGFVTPPYTEFQTYRSNLAPVFSTFHTGIGQTDVIYITLDSSAKLIKFKTPFDIRYTYRGRPNKEGVFPYQGCVLLVTEDQDIKNDPVFEMIVKIDGEFRSYKIMFDRVGTQIGIVQSPVTNNRVIEECRKIDERPKSPRFRVKLEKSTKVPTNLWVVDTPETFNKVADFLEQNMNSKERSRAHIMDITGLNDDQIIEKFRSVVTESGDRCFTMVDEAKVPYPVWKETKQLFAFKFDTENESLYCIKSI